MNLKKYKNELFLTLMVFLVQMLFVEVVFADNKDTAVEKKLSVGKLWNTDENEASGGWHTGYNWPGNRNITSLGGETRQANGTTRMMGPSLGMQNWVDRRGTNFPYLTYTTSSSVLSHTNNQQLPFGVTLAYKVVLRRTPPIVTVNGVVDPSRHPHDEIDPDLICDAKLVNQWATPVGVQYKMEYLSYAAENAENYMFLDFHMLNDGQIDADIKVELPDQDLHDVYFNYGVQPMMGYEGAQQNGNTTERTTDDWVEYYGENYQDYLNGDPQADSLRLFIVWDGNDSQDPYISIDDTGDPNLNKVWSNTPPRPLLGTILSPQYLGIGIIHADNDHVDETNDLSQPASAVWYPAAKSEDNYRGNQTVGYKLYFEGDGTVVGENWQRFRPSPQEMGFTKPDDIETVSRPNPYIAVGPYEMPFGSEINWTVLVSVNGLDKESCEYYGNQWYRYEIEGKDGITTEEKNALVTSGRDSLFKYYSRATRRYFRNIENGIHRFDTPDAPPAPDLSITSGKKMVTLTWSDVSGEPDVDSEIEDFSGYRVYRADGVVDNKYDMIWECGGLSGNPVVNTYTDYSVQPQIRYFYYVTAFDDGSQNWETPGKSVESGKYWNMPQDHSYVLPDQSDRSAVEVVARNYQFRVMNLVAQKENVVSHGILIDTLAIDIDDNTELSFDVRNTFSNHDTSNRVEQKHPANVTLSLERSGGEKINLNFAYDYRGGENSASETLVQIVYGKAIKDNWLRNQKFKIKEYISDAAKITGIWVGGEGWQYEAYFDNITIYSQTDTLFSDNFNDNNLDSEPRWEISGAAAPPPPPPKTIDDIVVVPNPYYWRGGKLSMITPEQENKIAWMNLPEECTIKIYTMSGDLVKTLYHNGGSTEEWFQINDYHQIMFSGIYIYYLESDKGSKIGKFVIIQSSSDEDRTNNYYDYSE